MAFSEDEMMSDLAAADAAGDSELAQHIAGKIKAMRAAPTATAQSPRQKMAGALNKLLPSVPESSEQAIGMGMGMSMPNPLPFVGQFLKGSAKAAAEGVKRAAGSMFPKAMEAGGAALDPVLQQAPRNPLPALPKILEHVPGIGTPTKIYNFVRGAAESLPREAPANPYPPTAAPVQSVLPQATAQPAPVPAQPPQQALPSAVNIFEKAARSDKVAQLVKAIDANAGMHLGVDMRDPRAAEALASLPAQWWEGMAQESGVNKPSQETINQALEFFRDRAAQGAQKLVAQ